MPIWLIILTAIFVLLLIGLVLLCRAAAKCEFLAWLEVDKKDRRKGGK